jgi:hypothetical protein
MDHREFTDEGRGDAMEAVVDEARFYFKDPASGAMTEVDVILCHPAEWESRPDSLNPDWSTRATGFGLVLALRMVR